jgi:hypothetical protein
MSSRTLQRLTGYSRRTASARGVIGIVPGADFRFVLRFRLLGISNDTAAFVSS